VVIGGGLGEISELAGAPAAAAGAGGRARASARASGGISSRYRSQHQVLSQHGSQSQRWQKVSAGGAGTRDLRPVTLFTK